jgi:hypothetical protein
MDEFMRLVLGPRHGSETTVLLQRHYEERIACLNPIVSSLLDEKNKLRLDTIERMAAEEASQTDVMKALGETRSRRQQSLA